jgi:hypothetical protein
MAKAKNSSKSTKAVRSTVAAKVGHASAGAALPSHEELCIRAYEIWEREGRPHGRDVEHWSLAMTELGV